MRYRLRTLLILLSGAILLLAGMLLTAVSLLWAMGHMGPVPRNPNEPDKPSLGPRQP